MPWLERRGNTFRIMFRYTGNNYSVPLKTADEREAEGSSAGSRRTFASSNAGGSNRPTVPTSACSCSPM